MFGSHKFTYLFINLIKTLHLQVVHSKMILGMQYSSTIPTTNVLLSLPKSPSFFLPLSLLHWQTHNEFISYYL